ncbi:MAG: hypothetical protein QOH81_1950 [Sphingomonadales bacterium]|nr:hypothetical protein [Sphingomonadales bacterium]
MDELPARLGDAELRFLLEGLGQRPSPRLRFRCHRPGRRALFLDGATSPISIIRFHRSRSPNRIRNIDYSNYGIGSAAAESASPQTGLDGGCGTADGAFVPPNHDRRLLPIAAILAGLWLAMLLLGGPASAADAALLQLFHLPSLAPFALLVTRLGNASILLPLSLAAAAWIVLRAGWRPAIVYALIVLSGRLLVELQKQVFGRVRPDPAGRLDAVATMAFPSGHAANSMVAWLGLALLAAPPRLRPAAVAAALALALLVGLSRLVLAVHWPSDVIGGWAFGAAWTLLLLRLAQGTSPPLRH